MKCWLCANWSQYGGKEYRENFLLTELGIVDLLVLLGGYFLVDYDMNSESADLAADRAPVL